MSRSSLRLPCGLRLHCSSSFVSGSHVEAGDGYPSDGVGDDDGGGCDSGNDSRSRLQCSYGEFVAVLRVRDRNRCDATQGVLLWIEYLERQQPQLSVSIDHAAQRQ